MTTTTKRWAAVAGASPGARSGSTSPKRPPPWRQKQGPPPWRQKQGPPPWRQRQAGTAVLAGEGRGE